LTQEKNEEQQRVSLQISDRASKAINHAIAKREERRKFITEGQADKFGKVRALLLVLGAGLLVIGKWLTLSGIRSNPVLNSDAHEPRAG
jgi:hypothetical protein